MKALSIKQPWSWLIVNGHKDIENRDWPTNFRGEVLIHAGKKVDDDVPDEVVKQLLVGKQEEADQAQAAAGEVGIEKGGE